MDYNTKKTENAFVLQYGTMVDILFDDLKKREDTCIYYVANPTDHATVIEVLRKVHTSIRLSQRVELPFKKVWYRSKLQKIAQASTNVFFSLDAAIHIGLRGLEEVKKKNSNTKFILILLDSIEAHSWTIKYGKHYAFDYPWDMVLSFDENDCEKYKFSYIGTGYYSRLINIQGCMEETDLFYIGKVKDETTRLKYIKDISQACKQNNIKSKIIISGAKIEEDEKLTIEVINGLIPYSKVVEMVLSANCILELVQPGQYNQTVRYMEAICYNKKLITNNKNVVTLPYYHPDYIKVFETVDDIDFSWIKEKEDINYNYKGDFSPNRIIDTVCK